MAAEGSRRGRAAVSLARVDVRLLAGAALVAISVVGSLTLWREAQITAPVVVAARAVEPGGVIGPGDLAVAEARLPAGLDRLSFAGADLPALAGLTAMGPLVPGELVIRPDLGRGPVIAADELAVTIPVSDDAVHARLRRGDLVAVMATTDAGQPESRTEALLERATVYAVDLEAGRVSLGGGGAGEEQGRPRSVTLLVPRQSAARVAHALVNAELTLMLAAPGDRAAASGREGGGGR